MRFLRDDEEQRRPSGSPKSELRNMLAEAVKNTGGVPVEQIVLTPTAHQVAVAIVTASREMGANPKLVAVGQSGNGENFPISRARAYAALAIRAVFEGIDPKAVGRMVGGSDHYVRGFDSQLKSERIPWWDDATFMRVVKAVESAEPSP